jgi:hypothetical protein
MCLNAVKKRESYTGLLFSIIREKKESLCTHDVCIAAVKSNGRALRHVPQPLIDARPELYYKAAVKTWGKALQLMDEKYQTEEICLWAVRNNYEALVDIKNKGAITEKIAIAALENNALAYLHYIPPELRENESVTAAYQAALQASAENLEKKTKKKLSSDEEKILLAELTADNKVTIGKTQTEWFRWDKEQVA